MSWKLKAGILTLICMIPALVHAQISKGRRDAYGSQRAGQAEELLRSLYPGAKVEWEPILAIRKSSGEVLPVDLGNFATVNHEDGTSEGVAGLEVGRDKLEHIKKLTNFQETEARAYTTMFVVFRTNASGHINDLKKVVLDPSDPLTKIDWFEVHSWPARGWPVLRVRYTSYLPADGSLTTIEWGGLLDTAAGSFVTRTPSGVFVKQKGGGETGDILSVHRAGPDQITIVSNATNKTIVYPCSDRCVVDGPTFLASWSK